MNNHNKYTATTGPPIKPTARATHNTKAILMYGADAWILLTKIHCIFSNNNDIK